MNEILQRLGLQEYNSGAWTDTAFDTSNGDVYTCHNPTDGSVLGHVHMANKDHLETVISTAQEKFAAWRMLPAPKRGEIVRLMGEALREHKDDLGALVSLEVVRFVPKVLEYKKALIWLISVWVSLDSSMV